MRETSEVPPNKKFAKMMRKHRLAIVISFCGCYFLLLNVSLRLLEGSSNKTLEDQRNNETANFYENTEKLATNLQDPISKLKLIPGVSDETFQKILELNDKAKSAATSKQVIIIVSAWRSGSSFLNQVFDSHPGTFNHYEPLHIYGTKRIYNGDPSSVEAQHLIFDLLKCRYRKLNYFQHLKKSPTHLTRNTRMKDICRLSDENIELGFQRNFLNAFCSIFPISLMKFVRAGMSLLEFFLEEPSLNSHFIYLVRDPRAVITSRQSSGLCDSTLCREPSTVCKFMTRDLDIALILKKKFPDRIHILRYEDMAWSPFHIIRKLSKDLGLVFVPEVAKFLEQHTTVEFDINNPWNLARDSSRRVIHWLTKIKENTLIDIESSCDEAMNRLGYLKIRSLNTLLKKEKFNNSSIKDFHDYSSDKVWPSLSWYDKLYKKIDY